MKSHFGVVSVITEAFTGFYVKTENVEAYIQHGSITAEFLVEATSQLTLKGISQFFKGVTAE